MYADQQDAVVEVRPGVRPDHGNVRGAAHLKRVGCTGAVKPRKAGGAAVCRAGRLEAAVLVDAEQLDGAATVP